MSGEACPGHPFVPARPDFSAGRPEIEPDWIMPIRCHRLTFHRPPGICPWKPFVLPRPGLAGIACHVGGWLTFRAHPWPDGLAVHREYPGDIGIPRMHHHWKTNVADFLWHVLPDPYPCSRGPIEPVDATMILLVQPVRIAGTESDTVGVVKGHGSTVEALNHVEPLHEGSEGLPTINGFVHSAS